MICGIDEVGRGPLAGPVVACACILPEHLKTALEYAELRDSKTLSAKKRERLAVWLRANAPYGIGEASCEEIDRVNILQATFLAMGRAFEALGHTGELMILVDGNHVPKALPKPCRAVVGGDATVPEIAAASIIAKVHRDALMEKLGLEFPQFEWHKNSGYGAPKHLAALREYGPTIHHRRSFAPVRLCLSESA